MIRPLALAALLPLLAAASVPSSPDLGKAEGRCRPNERGPAMLVTVEGLKDRQGRLKLEVYPATEGDFLQDDNILVSEGKVFSRVEQALPATGAPQLCIRVARAGTYALMVLHDRDSNRKFGWTVDGVGFSGNPRLGISKPDVARVRIAVGGAPAEVRVVLNYRRGLGLSPLRQAS